MNKISFRQLWQACVLLFFLGVNLDTIRANTPKRTDPPNPTLSTNNTHCVNKNGQPLANTEYRALTVLTSLDSATISFLSWRMLSGDDADTTYDVFASADGKQFRKLTDQPIKNSTNFIDPLTCADDIRCRQAEWFVRINQGAYSRCSEIAKLPVGIDRDKILIDVGIADFGRRFAFGDLNGDGRLEYVLRFSGIDIDPYYQLWRPSPSAYRLRAFDERGVILWEYDMGKAIEQGIWYSPYLIYDLDQDGKAELIVKAGDDSEPGAIRDESGRVVKGREYLKIISGEDGKTVIAQADWPSREGFVGKSSQPYSIYNHFSRNQMAIAYLDGKTPHVIVERGTYGKQKIQAYRLDAQKKLKQVWHFENQNPSTCDPCTPEQIQERRALWGQGAHTIRVGDLDSDGRDEIVIGSFALDDDGKVLWSIDKGDLDHIHLGDLNPSEPGLEIYYGAERSTKSGGMGMINAATGKYLWSISDPTSHIHKEGLCADLLLEHPGTECFSGESNRTEHWLWSSQGKVLSRENPAGPTLSPNAAYWADTPQKLLMRTASNRDSGIYADLIDLNTNSVIETLYLPSEMSQNDRQYFRVLAVADILGDWREEIIGTARGRLVIYMSRLPSKHRMPWLLQDNLYSRNAILGSMGYYQQPLLSRDPCTVFSLCSPATSKSSDQKK